ncbi:MAG: ribosome biogenesis GTPase YlqF [Erysipelotrichaceae bacterium]|nr:ribosome biogenesis GTPase YlqF [Erysipelotrichaceae bacterium]
MTIQWFPGHMAKAQREISERLNAVDMVIELRDCRIPEASRNPLLDKLCLQKPRLIILTKKDKADPLETEKWLNALNRSGKALAFDLNEDRVITPITQACLELMKTKHDRLKARGVNPRAVRALVIGIPNVGKSTLINRLSKRRVADTANRPGVTRALKLVTVNRDLELIDTPGVLWPKFNNELTGIYLAITGAIKDDILPNERLAVFGIETLIHRYPERLEKRYGVINETDPYAIIRQIGIRRGFLLNGEVDQKRTIDTLLKEMRADDLGRITWEVFHE